MIFDSHCHLHDTKFSEDLLDVLTNAQKASVSYFVTVGCDLETTQNAFALAQKHSNIFFSAGYHPHDAQFLNDDTFAKIAQLAQHEKCVAIGECGLDYYYTHSPKDTQIASFIKQIQLAQNLDLPLIIHLRDAYDDCYDILKTHLNDTQKVVIHCFSGTLDFAKKIISLRENIYLSIPGIITFKKAGDLPMVAEKIPLNRLLVETDAPYLAPVPHRGRRNEPSFITHTLDAICTQRSESPYFIKHTIFQNTLRVFGLQHLQK